MNEMQSSRASSSSTNQDNKIATLVAALKQHIANVESEMAVARRELNTAKDMLRKLEQLVGAPSSNPRNDGDNASPPRIIPRLGEPSSNVEITTPNASDMPFNPAEMQDLPPAARRVRQFANKILRKLGVEEAETPQNEK
jgi:hypothetical protein